MEILLRPRSNQGEVLGRHREYRCYRHRCLRHLEHRRYRCQRHTVMVLGGLAT